MDLYWSRSFPDRRRPELASYVPGLHTLLIRTVEAGASDRQTTSSNFDRLRRIEL